MNSSDKGRAAVAEAVAYLRYCGIRLPRFRLTTEPPKGRLKWGGSFVDGSGGSLRLNIGGYPTRFLSRWFAMHELGHLLWNLHRPLRWKRFRAEFGEPQPDDYENIHMWESAKTAGSLGKVRPKGEPSHYGARGGGEERFCELLGLMWAQGDFTKPPPEDLAGLWDTCWEHGLSRMT